jgi:uncharacterized protein YraI
MELAGRITVMSFYRTQQELKSRTDAINVRNGPSTQCASYGVAEIGASALATGISADGIWIQIQISTDVAPDGIGWVNVNYLIQSNTANLPVAQSAYCP